MNNKYQVDTYQIDQEYEFKFSQYSGSYDDYASNDEDSGGIDNGTASIKVNKKRKRRRTNKNKANVIMIASVLLFLAGTALFINKYPPANKFVVNKLVEYNVIRSM